MNTCNFLENGIPCGKSAIVRVLGHDEKGKPYSMYLCEEHFEEVQNLKSKDKSPAKKAGKEINHE
jgi:hypothetical protein